MVRRGMSPFVRETLERVAVGLWFIGILLLLYLTLRSQLARGNEPETDWDLVALCGGTVDVHAARIGGRVGDIDECTLDVRDRPAAVRGSTPRAAVPTCETAAAPSRQRPAP